MADMTIGQHQDPEWFAAVPRSIRRQAMFGILLLVLSFGGFGLWAFRAPLAAAVITPGSFVATGQNKIVQHLEGGIIESIAVSEGQQVEAGDVLLRLDQTAAIATERELRFRMARLEAAEARLQAEYRGLDRVIFPPHLEMARDENEIAAILDSQTLNFKVSSAAFENDLRLLRRDMEALAIRSSGYETQLVSYQRQLALLTEDHERTEHLFTRGLARRSEVSALQRAMVDAEGQLGRIEAEIREIEEVREKYEVQIETAIEERRRLTLDELDRVQAELDAIRERAHAAESVAERVDIVAPVSGTIVRLHYHTPGGVVESGRAIAEILPADAPLIIEALIPRNDIDSVHTGQPATVRLTALNQRTTPVLNGEVFYVSADSITDQSDGPPREVYVARVSLTTDELMRVPNFMPTPGMPATLMIQTQARTFAQYIVKPIADSMSRAFREE